MSIGVAEKARTLTNEAASTPSSERSIGSTPELLPREGDSPEPGTYRVLSPAPEEHKEEGGSRRGSFNDTGSRCSSLYLDQQQENSEPSCFARHKCALIGATTFGIIGLIGAILAVAYFCIPGTKKAIGGAIKQQIGAAALVTLGMGSAFGVIAYMVAKKVIDSRQDSFESVREGAQAYKNKLQDLRKKVQQNRHPLMAIGGLLQDSGLPNALTGPIKGVQQAIESLKERSAFTRDNAGQTDLQTCIKKVDDLEIQVQNSVQSGYHKDERPRLEKELATARATLQKIRDPLEQTLITSLDTLQKKTQDVISEAQDRYTKGHLEGFKKDLDNLIDYRNRYQKLAAEREQLKQKLHESLVCALHENKQKWQEIHEILSSV